MSAINLLVCLFSSSEHKANQFSVVKCNYLPEQDPSLAFIINNATDASNSATAILISARSYTALHFQVLPSPGVYNMIATIE